MHQVFLKTITSLGIIATMPTILKILSERGKLLFQLTFGRHHRLQRKCPRGARSAFYVGYNNWQIQSIDLYQRGKKNGRSIAYSYYDKRTVCSNQNGRAAKCVELGPGKKRITTLQKGVQRIIDYHPNGRKKADDSTKEGRPHGRFRAPLQQ